MSATKKNSIGKSIDEIAKEIGVSVTTVKLVVNGKADKYRIAKKTQQRIQDFISEHGLIINQAARSLKLKKTNTFGLIVPRLTNVFFSSLTEWLEQKSSEKGYQLITVCTDSNPDKEKEVTKNLIERGVDGLFIVPSSKKQQQNTVNTIPNKPIVFLDRDFEIEGQSTIVTDNYYGFLELTKKILAKSVSEVYVISGDSDLPSIRNRLQGFVDGHQQENKKLMPHWIQTVPHNRVQDGHDGMKMLIENTKRLPESIVFSSLPILEGGLHYLKEHYGVIPQHLIIGTFDDHTMLDFLPNPVVSVEQDAKSIADQAYTLMESLLEDKNTVPVNIVIPPKIIDRN